MDIIIDSFLNIDTHLADIISRYGVWTYLLLIAIIFFETGLVVTPFLPGDSLLFAAGALAAQGSLNIFILTSALAAAAIAGDAVNYFIGKKVGTKILVGGKFLGLPVRREHVERARQFYNTHGSKTIVIARFFPIIRTFAPFVAGASGMHYRQFAIFNVVGGVLWVALFNLGGFFFGNLPVVKNNFTTVIVGIVFLSLLPLAARFLRERFKR